MAKVRLGTRLCSIINSINTIYSIIVITTRFFRIKSGGFLFDALILEKEWVFFDFGCFYASCANFLAIVGEFC